ncbi:hypothetical protein LOTGIDRAFT_176024 [Lottia gigantea]|uniref:beta-mannosidase n=1 Tax=Lottia gigantea TaxID=225164 RepID=V3ZYZ9_LOTGI|nr:hypothetical protein LOTGIDRAFT_176024 [Lottia gigantea]ESO86231.1 hypothetical protein LOTGIDRAFT_176024 [Lottia gigantea]
MCVYDIVFILLIVTGYTDANNVLDLNGVWSITNGLLFFVLEFNIQGNVPGDVYTSLIQSRIIEDPYRRDNDVVYRPYAYYGYTYNRKFTVSEADFKSTKIELVCDGLDTFSDIMVNGVLVGSSDNMFIKYRYNIKHVIKPGINNITISFQSAVITAEALYNKSTYHIPSICPDAYHGFCHYNFIRKMEYSFSWDWGPAIPNQGIWRNIYVECYDIPKINSISVLPKQSGNTFYFRINGVPIFMKGANWVPPDTMLERITRDKIENILQSVIEGNMNLLTVSGVSMSNVKKMSPTEFTVTLTTNHIAPFVWINSRGISGRFSDNGFIMKDPQLQLTFTSWQPVDLKTFTYSLSVQSLMDIYH